MASGTPAGGARVSGTVQGGVELGVEVELAVGAAAPRAPRPIFCSCLLLILILILPGKDILASSASSDSALREIPWLASVQQPPAVPSSDPVVLVPLLRQPDGTMIDTPAAWDRRRHELRTAWLEFLGPLARTRLEQDAGRRAPPWTLLEADQADGIRRLRIRYFVEPDQEIEAYLLLPANTDRPRPGLVVFHSTVNESILQPAGIAGDPEKAFGLQFARLGFVTLSPRNFLWPANRGIDARAQTRRFQERHPESKGMDRMLLDGIAAVDLLASLPEVDPERLGCVGHSLGAKEALYLAAFDERIRATVSSEGGIGIGFSNWHDDWYLGPTIREPGFNREHHELLAFVAPRPLLLIGGDSADGDRSWPFIEAALPVYRLYGPIARIGLFNHRRGHAVPPEALERIESWMLTYLE
jgi:hypothetical protein